MIEPSEHARMESEGEFSAGGSRILRHASTDRPAGVAETDMQAIASIEEHLRAFIGEPTSVFHELISDIVHIDVHIIPPSGRRRCTTLVTTGMSDLPMSAPDDAQEPE